MSKPSITLHKDDLPEDLSFGPSVAVDTETLGLNLNRDRLCLVQLSAGDGSAHLVQFDGNDYAAPRLKALLADNLQLPLGAVAAHGQFLVLVHKAPLEHLSVDGVLYLLEQVSLVADVLEEQAGSDRF